MLTITETLRNTEKNFEYARRTLEFAKEIASRFPNEMDIYDAQMQMIQEYDKLKEENELLYQNLEKEEAIIKSLEIQNNLLYEIKATDDQIIEKLQGKTDIGSGAHYPAENETPVANVILEFLKQKIKDLEGISSGQIGYKYDLGKVNAYRECEQFCRLTFQARKGEIIT